MITTGDAFTFICVYVRVYCCLFWFYFLYCHVIAMFYNRRYMYVWYVELNSTYLLTYLLNTLRWSMIRGKNALSPKLITKFQRKIPAFCRYDYLNFLIIHRWSITRRKSPCQNQRDSSKRFDVHRLVTDRQTDGQTDDTVPRHIVSRELSTWWI